MTEEQFQRSVISAARDLGFLAYATYRSMRSEPGFPDVVAVKPPRVIFMELKSDQGRLTRGRWNQSRKRWLPGQDDWARAFQDCPGVEYYLFRPSQVEEVYRVLAGDLIYQTRP